MQKYIDNLSGLYFRFFAWRQRKINKITPEILYKKFGRLIETMPDLNDIELTDETYRWFGDAHALVRLSGELTELNSLVSEINILTDNAESEDMSVMQKKKTANKIRIIIYRHFATAKLKAPSEAQEFFILAGTDINAFTAISKIFNRATTEILIIDRYLDETLFTNFAPAIPEGVNIKLLVSKQIYNKRGTQASLKKWIRQYGGKRPTELRVVSHNSLHDRLVIINNTELWKFSQSFNIFAKHSPASIECSQNPTPMIDAFTRTWDNAESIQP